jgi:hypothetical protein
VLTVVAFARKVLAKGSIGGSLYSTRRISLGYQHTSKIQGLSRCLRCRPRALPNMGPQRYIGFPEEPVAEKTIIRFTKTVSKIAVV